MTWLIPKTVKTLENAARLVELVRIKWDIYANFIHTHTHTNTKAYTKENFLQMADIDIYLPLSY